jgi:hypothetical protein
MVIISTFELLIKPQLPKALAPALPPNVSKLSRNVIQGYFLTLANLGDKEWWSFGDLKERSLNPCRNVPYSGMVARLGLVEYLRKPITAKVMSLKP